MTDKMKNSIRENMLDELLSDIDKPKPPVKDNYNYSRGYSGQDSFDWGRGDDTPSSFLDDDGPDPMDSGYAGYSKPHGGRHHEPKRTGGSVFSRRTSHENVLPSAKDDYAAQIAGLVRTTRRASNFILLETAERDELVGILMKMIGVQLDKAGITWGTEGLKAFRETLKDLVPMAYYGTTKFVMEDEDDEYADGQIGKLPDGTLYDRETGEEIGHEEDIEERRAIMEENAGHE